ncbi:MAG: glutamate mutase L, partial [Anaerolineae bacterium]|nr:glutamate mutase L [Anaerolineae bacterium]
PDEQIDAILRARPDLIVLAGGTDGGASRSVHMMLDTAGLACYLMPKEKRPAILFAGNNSLADDVKRLLESLTPALHFSPNLRPSLDVEDLDPAMSELSQIVTGIRRGQLRGVDELEAWSNGHVFPTAYATGRMTRFLSRLTGASGGVLSVTLGASAASVAAGFNGDLCLRVYPQYGLGENLAALAQNTDPDELIRWLSLDIHQNSVRDAIYQRSLYPSTVPATPEERAISQALARHTLHLAVRAAQRDFPPAARSDLLPAFEFIFASGAALTDGATPGQNLLLLLDALQPTGVTQAMLDRNNLLPLLGAAADLNQLLPVQALESGAFLNLGTTVSVVSAASHGAPVLRARLRYADRNEANIEVKRGALELLPLGAGEAAKLTLQPLHRADVGFGPGRGQTITVHGGALGLVIDARGRPLQLPSDAVRRRELFKKWLWTLGG